VKDREFGNAGWSGKTTELAGDESFGGTASAEDKTIAGLVPVSRSGKIQGAYAWHVSDESVKARINSYRDPNQNATLAQKRALLAGHRPDVSVINHNGKALDFLPSDLTSSSFDEAMKSSDKILDLDQVDLLGNGDEIKTFRNHVTPYSLGLLTDVRNGGLKQDLSSIFEMTTNASTVTLPSDFNNRKLYQSTHGITGVSDPFWSALSSYYNTFRGMLTPDSSPTFYQRPTQSTAVTSLAPSTRFYPGPVVAKVEALFSYVTRDSHSNWVGTLKAVDPQMLYMGHLVYTPLITLHNPYNVNLQFDNIEITIRNVPIAFNFYANNVPQSSKLVPLTDMFVNGGDRREKSFVMKIANWSTPASASTATTGNIIMRPGQTLVCGPYLDPKASFSNNMGTPFFDWQNNLTGTDSLPIKAKPGYVGRCVGFDVDWTTPTHSGLSSGRQTDQEKGVFGLRATDTVYMEYAVQQPSMGLNTEFQVTAKLTSQGRTFDYGGLSFQYQDNTTLKKYFNKTYRYPLSGALSVSQTYVPNTDPISSHANAQTVAVFSAYARTTNGGVYETNKRVETPGALNALRDGRLAGKPFLFHNPARTVVRMNMRTEKPGGHSHEMNFQQFLNLGQVEDYFNLDATNRTPYITGNTSVRGVKSGSYLELPTGPMQTIADFRRSNALSSSYLPNFVQPVANSSVSPLMSTDKVVQTDSAVASYALLDHSVLANHALYDRFYFSTFATNRGNSPDTSFEKFMDGTSPLISQSFEPYLPPGKTISSAKSELFSGGKPTDTAYLRASEYQMVRGAFNVNSTNVQAWKAVLSSMRKSDIYSLMLMVGANGTSLTTNLVMNKPDGALITATSLPNGENATGGKIAKTVDELRANEWNGYRDLSDGEVENLAKNIVDQVRTRGPFLSMSEFVNRQIGSDSDKTRMGALEAAISESRINEKMFSTQIPITQADISDANLYNYKTPLATIGNPAAGAPGWVSQGDLLRIIEPTATVRSDTFVVRVCGESWDAGGRVTARAYAEAVVQRIPEYVDPADRPSLNVYTDGGAAPANKTFGRRMSVVSFRWLSSKEV
jgi:hypothetical protein